MRSISKKVPYRDLTYTQNVLTNAQLVQLKCIIATSFSNVEAEHYFALYFEKGESTKRRLRLFLSGGDIVGYCLLTFDDSNKDVCIVGASAAFLPDFRGKNSTFRFSLIEVLKRYIRNPRRKLLYADTMLSPAMFRAMAKNIAEVYPNNLPQNSAIATLYDTINPSGLVSPHNGLRCLKAVGRKTNYSEAEIARFRESSKTEIALYCSVNPDFDKGIALVVIIPISLTQFILTLKKILSSRVSGVLGRG
ncbi:hypothetical protein [Pseudoalteromonas maricaloris]|uniref:N-acetyltransferase domain-containing protein n=1 Tax=Pseudoalteromonas maricaloris TaxID=184924 RepID=A0ABZ0MBF8_9GAMM|nr:hypothetical protein [Pseudoalteromonas maricaloris]WOX28412.1 hypothetical protein R5H13_17595 [Pseudoalteromonas maricaloris]